MPTTLTDTRRMGEGSLLRAVLETLVDGLITIDEKGIVNSFNPAAERIFGYSFEEVIGQNIKILMPEPYRSSHDEYLTNYRRTGTAKIIGSGREVVGRKKDGSTFPLDLAVSEMWLGPRRMFVGLIRDITLRKAAETQIKRYMQEVEQSNQDLDEFAYIASHDLKEPLRGMANNAMFLKEDYETQLDEAGVKRLDRIVFLCHRMERLVNDLLNFSRIGRQQLAIKATDLNAVIDDIKATMEAVLHDEHVEISVPKPLPTVVCDATRVTEVFRNLVTNSIKYNKSPEKRIEIGTVADAASKGKTELVFYVRDNGVGIAPEFHTEIFRLFKRLNNEDQSVMGTGGGLTFVKKIVERHHGRIWVESKPGEGATFFFTLNDVAEGCSDE